MSQTVRCVVVVGVESDAELLRSPDPEAFGRFYTRHRDAVTSYVARRVRRPDLTFDVVAETFARALQHRRRYDPTRAPAIAWLLQIARNLILDAVRRHQVASSARERLGFTPVALDDEALERVEALGRLDLGAALAALPSEQREAVLLRVVADRPYPDIAVRVGCSPQVVRQRVSRGLAALRRFSEESA